ncbi:MAG: LamG-like jellyroll fold domain-containing protein, partial [Candidatus Paceibacterota bacterium]
QALDSSGNNNTGTLTNGPTWQQANNCKTGGCLSFDGVDDYVAVSDSSNFTFTSGVTMNFWIKKSNTPINYTFISKSEFPVYSASDSYVYFYIRDNATNSYIGRRFLKTLIEDNNFKMITVTWNGGVLSSGIIFYMNGIPLSTTDYSYGTFSAPRINTNPISMFSTINGLADDPRVYNRALSSAEILTLYNATR